MPPHSQEACQARKLASKLASKAEESGLLQPHTKCQQLCHTPPSSKFDVVMTNKASSTTNTTTSSHCGYPCFAVCVLRPSLRRGGPTLAVLKSPPQTELEQEAVSLGRLPAQL